TITLHPGDVVVQFTDGVSEAFDPSGTEQFGIERLRKAAEKKAREGTRPVIDAICEDLRGWTNDSTPFDDETLVVLSRANHAVIPRSALSAAELVASAAAGNNAAADLIALARSNGQPLHIPAKLEALSGLKEWLSTCRDLRELSLSERTVLESALYEVCANVIEHGYREDSTQRLEMSWLPADSFESTSADAAGRVREGLFVLIDRAAPFAAGFQRNVNLKDPAVRKRGRGLGLEIIRGAMEEITVLPETPEGNVTVLRFDPAKVRVEEVRHVF
ncbi:MAG TPA: ATP-binding protein, partial [bacterium]|nr:ATP-binding protein [bacterium]